MTLDSDGISFVNEEARLGLRNLQLRLDTNRGVAVVGYGAVGQDEGVSFGEAELLGGLRVRTEAQRDLHGPRVEVEGPSGLGLPAAILVQRNALALRMRSSSRRV